MKVQPFPPDLDDQPVLVIEVPRELINPRTTLKYCNQIWARKGGTATAE
jgi:hypothetical protein